MAHLISLFFSLFVLSSSFALSPFEGEQGGAPHLSREDNANLCLKKDMRATPKVQFFATTLRELTQEGKCPASLFSQYEDYIRYTFRLLILSFLFESLQNHKNLNEHLGKELGACNLNWPLIFQKCHPTSKEMKKFCKLAPNAAFSETKSYQGPKLADEDVKALWKKEQMKESKESSDSEIDEQQMRMVLQKKLSSDCEQKLNLFQKICSEEDLSFGLSTIPEAKKLVAEASTLSMINGEGKGKECIERFIKTYAPRERIDYYLPTLFREVMMLQKKKNDLAYLQGKLYIPGALGEFEAKGVSLTLFSPAPKPPAPATTPTILASGPPLRPQQKKSPKVTNVITTSVTPTPIPVAPLVSIFERAYQEMRRSKNRQIVELPRLLQENPFDQKAIAHFDSLLKDYQTLPVLKELKTLDQFGDKDHPVGMTFIKYLLTAGHTESLLNLIQVLGEKFYVINDLEQKTVAVKARLYYIASPSFPWHLELLPD